MFVVKTLSIMGNGKVGMVQVQHKKTGETITIGANGDICVTNRAGKISWERRWKNAEEEKNS